MLAQVDPGGASHSHQPTGAIAAQSLSSVICPIVLLTQTQVEYIL